MTTFFIWGIERKNERSSKSLKGSLRFWCYGLENLRRVKARFDGKTKLPPPPLPHVYYQFILFLSPRGKWGEGRSHLLLASSLPSFPRSRTLRLFRATYIIGFFVINIYAQSHIILSTNLQIELYKCNCKNKTKFKLAIPREDPLLAIPIQIQPGAPLYSRNSGVRLSRANCIPLFSGFSY